MFKVLLVDDEVYVRKGLIELIPWKELKLDIIGEANNGKEALELIKKLEPDLIITDICMPLVDGLGLIRSVKEDLGLDPSFVVISGYSDFAYAQQALRFGVHDYLLKPINEAELIDTLRKLTYAMGDKKNMLLSGEEHAGKIFLEALIQGALPNADAEQYAAALGIGNCSSYLFVIAELYAAPQHRMITLRRFEEVLMTAKELTGSVLVTELHAGKYGMLLNGDCLSAKDRDIEETLQKLCKVLSNQLDMSIGLYAGNSVLHISELHYSYMEACEAARHKFAESSEVIHYANIKDKPLYIFDMNSDIVNQLLLQVEEGNREAYSQLVERMFVTFQEHRFAAQALISSLARCVKAIAEVVKAMEGTEEQIASLMQLVLVENNHWNLSLLKEHFMLGLIEAEEYMALLRKKHSSISIKKIKHYIDTHYHENITLKSIAATFYMNALYLGRIFRKSYGVYFNEYLLGIRIEEAKRLLRQTDLKIYEIAHCVGFQNADYFVTQFEKLVKMSPTEYRNRLINKA